MRKFIKKLICFAVCTATVAGVLLTAGCSNYYSANVLDGNWQTTEKAESNGGFAVKKGEYIYFINGKVTDSSVDNSYGTPVKGALVRIHEKDFANRNYTNVQAVVPQVMYSGNYNSGIYIYGDYVYYSTPSLKKNSDGAILSSNLEFKSAKLNGSESMKGSFYTSEDNTIEYRFVEENGVVYLMYVISEDLYGTGTSYTNIHSVNTQTGVDTLLAYNVSSYVFDEKDLENPNVYYTMSVNPWLGRANSSSASYNQIYRVSAAVTEANEYDFSYVADFDAEEDPLYINCGDLIFDGIGVANQSQICQFNMGLSADYQLTNTDYTFALSSYETIQQNGEKVPTLFYTRKPVNDSVAALFTLTDMAVDEYLSTEAYSGKAVEFNPAATECVLYDASNASGYEYVNVNGVDKILSIDGSNILIGQVDGGKIATSDIADKGVEGQFAILNGSVTPEILFIDGSYVYYTNSGDYVYRVAYDGDKEDYTKMPIGDNCEYEGVKILEIDAAASWYKPEIIDGQLIYASDTDIMSAYGYIEVCDLRNSDGSDMTNADLKAHNKLWEDIEDKISAFSATDYENLQNALHFAFYADNDNSYEIYDYINEVITSSVEIGGKDEDYYYTTESQAIYWDFVKHTSKETGVWAEYANVTRKFGDDTVAANRKDYFYSLLGVMSEEDKEDYDDQIKDTYMVALTEDDSTWWDGLSTVAKVFFIIGVSIGGLLVLGALAFIVLKVIKKNDAAKKPVYRKAKRTVDTTDDKSIDVYGDNGDYVGDDEG